MRYLITLAAFVLVFVPATLKAQEAAVDPALDSFAKKIIEVFASGDPVLYQQIIHSGCPAPDPQRTALFMSEKWVPAESVYRIKSVAEVYDRSQLDFTVEPEAALEFQVWKVSASGGKRELVISFPVAADSGELKILDYPCFQPKSAE